MVSVFTLPAIPALIFALLQLKKVCTDMKREIILVCAEIEGLKRKLTSKLAPTASSIQPDWQVLKADNLYLQNILTMRVLQIYHVKITEDYFC
jgi:hypothetical protein